MKVHVSDLSPDATGRGLHESCSKTVRLFYKDNTDFSENAYDLNIDVDTKSNYVHLAKGVTYADEMGNCTNRDVETITKTQWIRKEFWIDQPETDDAQLLVYIKSKPNVNSLLHIVVNDRKTVIFEEVEGREYWDACWTSIPIPGDILRAGLNTFILQAEGDESWEILVEQSRLPNRSAKSRDAGRNWDDEHLGVNDACDGEYVIRLRMEQYPSRGVMQSGVVDIGRLVTPDGIATPFNLNRIEFNLKAETEPNANVDLEYRLGSTPEYDVETWTDWESTIDLTSNQFRYLQWQMTLLTNNPLITPCVKELEIRVDIHIPVQMEQPKLEVIEQRLSEQIRSSHHFSYLPSDTKRAQIFRERWKLDDVIAGATSEFDQFVRLSEWTRHQWENGWDMGEIDFCPPWDGLVILELASRKLGLGMCTHYSTVFVHACVSLGLIARTLVIRCHCVAEVWSEEYEKWIMIDTGGDSSDQTKATYYYVKNNVPMSALEIHNAWINQDFDSVGIRPEHAAKRFENDIISRAQLFERFCIHLRNDELRTLSPGEPEHGLGSYHYDGYLWWKDDHTPPHPWFSKNSSREGDFYWTPNHVGIYLSRSDHPEILNVDLSTQMPNIKDYLVQMDGNDWISVSGQFHWKLRQGENQLRVKMVNQFGWESKESYLITKSH